MIEPLTVALADAGTTAERVVETASAADAARGRRHARPGARAGANGALPARAGGRAARRLRRGPGARRLPLLVRDRPAARRRDGWSWPTSRTPRRSPRAARRGRGDRVGARPRQHPGRDQDPGLAGRAGPAAARAASGWTSRCTTSAWLREHGFGGVLAVGGAAAAAARGSIEARWRPRGARAGPHVVLVGKGITFDTGGLNIKTGDGMKTMKTDMAGGAAVLAALAADRRDAAAGPGHRARARRRERRSGRVLPAGGRATPRRRAHQRDHQHRRRGAMVLADALGLRRRPAAADRARRRRHAHRRDEGGAGAAHRRAVRRPPTSWPASWSTPGRRPASRCGACRCRPSTSSRSTSEIADADQRSRQPRRASPPRCSCGTSPATCRGRTSTSPDRRARREDDGMPDRGRHRIRRPAARRVGGAQAWPELVLPLVVRIERADPPARTDALEAAARAVLRVLSAADRRSGGRPSPPGTVRASARWCAGRGAPSGGAPGSCRPAGRRTGSAEVQRLPARAGRRLARRTGPVAGRRHGAGDPRPAGTA